MSSEHENKNKNDVKENIKYFEEKGDKLLDQYDNLVRCLDRKLFPNKSTEMFYRLPLSEKQRGELYKRLMESS